VGLACFHLQQGCYLIALISHPKRSCFRQILYPVATPASLHKVVPCPVHASDLSQECGLTLTGLSADANTRPWNVQLIATSLFQITEWTYQIVVSSQSDPQALSREVPIVYNKCLDWYSDFFSLLPPDGGRTPWVLFIQ